MPLVEFAGTRQGLRIRCHTDDAAVEFRLDGEQPEETILAPWEPLNDVAGSGRERVVELRDENGLVLASWRNGRVPRVVQYDMPAENKVPWPDSPGQLTENPPTLLKALAEATATTDRDSPRYALSSLPMATTFSSNVDSISRGKEKSWSRAAGSSAPPSWILTARCWLARPTTGSPARSAAGPPG